MDGEKIRELRLAHPFRAFKLVLDDGRMYLIDKPYYLAISPDRRTVIVAESETGPAWFGAERVREAVVVDSSQMA